MLANRVREYSTTVGTGDLTLMGAMTGFVRFSDAFGLGDQVAYVIEDGGNFEVGTGTLTAADTLARTSVLETLEGGVHTKGVGAGPITLSGNARILCTLTTEYITDPDKQADIIRELTPGAGVTVEDVLIKAGDVTALDVGTQTAAVAGTLTVGGAFTASGPVTVNNDFTVAGTMTVNGDLVTNTSYQVAIGDSILELNAGLTGAPTTDAGLLINRGTSPNVSFEWIESLGQWQASNDLDVIGALSATSLTVTGDIAADAGALTGALSVGGQITTPNGTAAAPFIAPITETNSGLYRIAGGTLGVSLLGTEVVRFDGGGLQVKGTGAVRVGGGTAATPGFCFVGATDMGMSNLGGDLALSAAGLEGMRVMASDQSVRAISGLTVGNTTNLVANADFVVQGSRAAKIGGTGPNYYTYFQTDSGTSKGSIGALSASFRVQALSSMPLELFNTQGLGLTVDNATGNASFDADVGVAGNLATTGAMSAATAEISGGAQVTGGGLWVKGQALGTLTGAGVLIDNPATGTRIGAYDADLAQWQTLYLNNDALTLEPGTAGATFAGPISVAGLASLANIKGASASGLLTLSGSSTGTTFGANIQLYAEGNLTNPGDMVFRSNSNPWLSWSSTNQIATFTLGGSELAHFDVNGLDVTGAIRVAAGLATYPGYRFRTDASTGLYSIASGILGVAALGAEQARFDGNTGKATFAGSIISGNAITAVNDITAGGSVKALNAIISGSIFRGGGAGILGIGGGTTYNVGGRWFLYGESHATQANDIEAYAGAVKVLQYDDSATLWDFFKNVRHKKRTYIGDTATGQFATTYYPDTATYSIFHVKNDLNRLSIGYGGDAYTSFTEALGITNSGGLEVAGGGAFGGNVTIANVAPKITFQDTDQGTGAETVIDAQNGNLTLDIDRLNTGGSSFAIKKRGVTVLSIGTDDNANFSGNIGTTANLGLGINSTAPAVMLDVDTGNHQTLACTMRGRSAFGLVDRGALVNIANRSTVSNIGLLIEGTSGQTGDLIQVRSVNAGVADLFAVSPAGDVSVGGALSASGNITTAANLSGAAGYLADHLYMNEAKGLYWGSSLAITGSSTGQTLSFTTNGVERVTIGPGGLLTVGGDLTIGDLKGVRTASDTGNLNISGGSSSTTGANIQLFGGSQATTPNYLNFRIGTTIVGQFNPSVNLWDFQSYNMSVGGLFTASGGATVQATANSTVTNALDLKQLDGTLAGGVAVNAGGIVGWNATNYHIFNIGGAEVGRFDAFGLGLSSKFVADGGAKLSVQNAVDGTSAYGLWLWSSLDSSYAIYMASAGAGKSLANGIAAAALDGRVGVHVRNRVYNHATQGYLWENSTEIALMSLTADTGDLYTLGSVNAGAGLTVGGDITRSDDTGVLYVSGGSAVNSGANVVSYAGTHATQAGDMYFRDGSSAWFWYDADAVQGTTGVINIYKDTNFNNNIAANVGTFATVHSTGNVAVDGILRLGAPTTLTIAAGVVTITKSLHDVDTEAAAATDTLTRINGGVDGDELTLVLTNGTRIVTINNSDNIRLASGTFTFATTDDTITFVNRGGVWREKGRSINS
ncbi:beta strand repeat-containing protein [Kordiimonas marina]|uniref:beta strand repeat-containing protein n=1 Tax=Kordiimonas marina TaxID=2872312 RepID=UPI001FF4DEC4|nr:hypothetical protein [Kordiimonas marina]MCJ9428684.1 hypothetical protein [Kordiimonas marina]